MKPTAAALWSDFCKIHYLDLPTPDEAERAARKLYRFAMGESWDGTIAVNPRAAHSFINFRVLRVGCKGGWPTIIHDLAWSFVRRANPGETDLGRTCDALDLKMTKEFFKRKWWMGVLKPEIVVKPKPAKDQVRHSTINRLRQRREAWEKKQQRAINAIKKIDRSLNAYERLTRSK
jgi:hypothetical protein